MTKFTNRDYELARKVGQLSDDSLIGSNELAAFLGISVLSIRTKNTRVPPRVYGLTRKSQWQMGEVRTWLKVAQTNRPTLEESRRPGRPTKAEQIARKAL